jgi:hypothetical protein
VRSHIIVVVLVRFSVIHGPFVVRLYIARIGPRRSVPEHRIDGWIDSPSWSAVLA